jgi:hypothetical protein
MSKQSGEGNRLKCSFCTKTQDQVKKLIAGPGVYICDECVDLCNEILDEELFGQPDSQPAKDLNRLQEARQAILRTTVNQSHSWVVRRTVDSLKGIQILVQDMPLGDTTEEKVLYASALDDLLKDRCLSKCGEDTYQVTWAGFRESKRLESEKTNNHVSERIHPKSTAELLAALQHEMSDNPKIGSENEKTTD